MLEAWVQKTELESARLLGYTRQARCPSQRGLNDGEIRDETTSRTPCIRLVYFANYALPR